jgi:hypothetical protein
MLRQIAGENPAPETAKPCFDAADGTGTPNDIRCASEKLQKLPIVHAACIALTSPVRSAVGAPQP